MPNLDVVITLKELQILFNQVQVMSDGLHVSYPVIKDFELLDAEPENDGYSLDVKTPDFSMFKEEYPDVYEELPAFNDFKECFLASGCISYQNASRFDTNYKSYKEKNIKYFFAPDANILYHGFLSRSFLEKERIPLAPTALNEITDAMNYKYNEATIDALREATGSDLFRAFFNRRQKKARKGAYLAAREKRKLVTITVDPTDETPTDASQDDLFIIKELRQFMESTKSTVVILTADRQASDLCEMENMEFFRFDMPARIEAQHCSARSFQELIFNLAAIFGVIKLNNTLIFGEFGNKNDFDELKVQFLNPSYHQMFMKDFNLCRRLMALKKDLIAMDMDF